MTLPRPLEAAMAILCGILFFVVIYQITSNSNVPEVDPYPFTPHFKKTNTSFFSPPSEAAFDIIDQRPLFVLDRKPVAAAELPGGPEKGTLPPPNATLVGIISDAHKQLALIKTQGSPFANSVSVGMSVEGWQVSEIGVDHVLLRAGSTQITLTMNGARSSTAAVTSNQSPVRSGAAAIQNPIAPPPITPAVRSPIGQPGGSQGATIQPPENIGKK